MQAEKDKVVYFHYSVSDVDGAEIENSRSRDKPMAFLFGHGNVISGLEQAIAGHVAGDRLETVLGPEQAYGERREGAVQRVPKKYFNKQLKLKPGITTVLHTDKGPHTVVVLKVGSSVVDVDTNHPLAGKTLRFEVEITDIREATPEEISHGHVHGDGQHGH